MIDIHMIDSGRFQENATRQIEKLRHPLVTVHITPPVWGNVLQARAHGYARGSHPYVAHVDDDDEVLDTDWLERAVNILENCPDVSAVYPRYRLTLAETGLIAYETPVHNWHPKFSLTRQPPFVHNFTVMRRRNVTPFFDLFVARVGRLMTPELLLFESQARFGTLVSDPAMAYHWIVRKGSGSSHAVGDLRILERCPWAMAYIDMTRFALSRHGRLIREQAAAKHV